MMEVGLMLSYVNITMNFIKDLVKLDRGSRRLAGGGFFCSKSCWEKCQELEQEVYVYFYYTGFCIVGKTFTCFLAKYVI